MAVPPPLMAQNLGGAGFPPSGGTGLGPRDILPGYPVVTNPSALQPLAPPQTPCPAVPSRNLQGVAHERTTLNDFWPMEPSSVLPASAEQRMRQERAEHQKGLALTDPLQAGQAAGKGLSSPLETQAFQSGQAGAKGLLGPLETQPRGAIQDLTTKDFTVEEAFSQFSVLHGVKGRLQQFGYDFFDTQATSFAPVLDAPVGPDYVVGPLDSLSIHIWNVPDQNLNRSYIVASRFRPVSCSPY